MTIFAVTLAIPADTPDDAIRGLRRLTINELAERAQVEEVIGDPIGIYSLTLAQVRERLGVGV